MCADALRRVCPSDALSTDTDTLAPTLRHKKSSLRQRKSLMIQDWQVYTLYPYLSFTDLLTK